MVTVAKKLTYADYAKIPADGFRHEIIGGEEFRTPSPNPDHQTAVVNFARILSNHAVAMKLGRVFVAPMDVVLSDHDIVEPDVFFVAQKRLSIIGPKNIEGVPDLVIEVLSPSTASQDRGPKLALYERVGALEYWIADPAAKTVEVREFGSPRSTRVYKEGQSSETAILQGLTVSLSDIFAA
jgi:Uma2 family endonuclease